MRNVEEVKRREGISNIEQEMRNVEEVKRREGISNIEQEMRNVDWAAKPYPYTPTPLISTA